jgi:hypothetical protein
LRMSSASTTRELPCSIGPIPWIRRAAQAGLTPNSSPTCRRSNNLIALSPSATRIVATRSAQSGSLIISATAASSVLGPRGHQHSSQYTLWWDFSAATLPDVL